MQEKPIYIVLFILVRENSKKVNASTHKDTENNAFWRLHYVYEKLYTDWREKTDLFPIIRIKRFSPLLRVLNIPSLGSNDTHADKWVYWLNTP